MRDENKMICKFEEHQILFYHQKQNQCSISHDCQKNCYVYVLYQIYSFMILDKNVMI